jgi:DNA ligase-1
MILPTLYKKSSTGAIQEWTISVYEEFTQLSTAFIETRHGQVGGKIQVTTDPISKGKNTGKANATTPLQQAEAEAKAKHEKQLKKGYVMSIEAAEAGEVDEIIEGGINPMLAHSFAKQGHKIEFPCFAQPKLDGIRCIAILKDNKCQLWSRTRKLITGVPHISSEIEKRFSDMGDMIFDGELYNHYFKNDFEKIVSFVRQEEPAEGHEVVQYHIYDLVNKDPFTLRSGLLEALMVDASSAYKPTNTLVLVPTKEIPDEDSVGAVFASFLENGYEGAMLRNSDGLYVNKRSYDLQKVKEFQDAEFPIAGICEGRGKLAGHAIFICKLDTTGTTFQVKMKGDTAKLKEFFEDHSLWEGKLLTVQYQGFTSYAVPRFPVGLRIREDL